MINNEFISYQIYFPALSYEAVSRIILYISLSVSVLLGTFMSLKGEVFKYLLIVSQERASGV